MVQDTLNKNILGVKALKTNSQPGDAHQDGSKCTIIAESSDTSVALVYLALFNDYPLPVGIVDYKIKLLANEKKKPIKLTKQQKLYLMQFPEGMFKYYTDEQLEKDPEESFQAAENQEKS